MARIDIEKQNQTISRLRDELSRLNQRFDEAKKTLGLPENEEVVVPDSEVPPQLAEAMKAVPAAAPSRSDPRPAAAPRDRRACKRRTPHRTTRGFPPRTRKTGD
mgnify:CR=1 FL=1